MLPKPIPSELNVIPDSEIAKATEEELEDEELEEKSIAELLEEEDEIKD